MSKSIKILAFYALLIVFVQSLDSSEPKKDSFNPSQIQITSNELKDDSNIIEIDILSEKNKNILVGLNGILCLKTEYSDFKSNLFDPETIEQDTSFVPDCIDDELNIFSLNCRLWMTSDTMYLFCEHKFNNRYNSITISNTTFTYKSNYSLKIGFNGAITFEQSGIKIPFIYSYEQTINLDESQLTYELKFKIQTYNNEILFINGTGYNYALLDDCQENNKQLICKMSREKIEEILILNNESFTIGAMNDDWGLVMFDCVSKVIILYQNVTKEDIFINFEKIVGGITEVHTPFAVESNVTEIPNFISDFILPGLYFKKMSGKPLMLFFEYPMEDDEVIIESSPNETTFNNFHYKYNFRVQPYQFNETIKIKNQGTNVLLTHPENIIFDSEDSIIIRYIINQPDLITDIKLDPNSKTYLDCDEINGMMKCELPISHFNSMKSGYYNIYHKNHEDNFNIYYNAPFFNITFPKADNISNLYIEEKDNNKIQYIGFQGILNFVLDYNDNETNIFNASDIEDKTNFESTIIIDDLDTKNVFCKLWKPIDEKLNMYCKLENNLTYGEHSFKLSSSSFYYYDRKFEIIQKAERLFLFQLNENFPFLYSSKQTLNIEEKIETYDLKFKIGAYNNEYFIITGESSGSIILDECSVDGKELICKIEKEVIEEFASYNGQKLSMSYSILQSEQLISMNYLDIYSVYGIYINYPLNKQNISVEINKLLQSNVSINSFITYETNVTNIENVYTKKFVLKLSNGNNIECSFRKTEGINLVVICLSSEEGEFSLGETKDQITLNDINIKYNFIIQPINNTENWKSSGNGSFVLFNVPKVLNFNLSDSITIDYAVTSSQYSNGFKLNPNAIELVCDDINDAHKRCNVPKSHFTDEDSGYYYTYHKNVDNNYIMYYESSPFKVILPKNIYILIKNEDNENIINIGEEGVFALKTDYNNKQKILDSNDNITFEGSFIVMFQAYKTNCRIWIPNDDNLRIICKFDESLQSNYKETISLEKVEIPYKDYIIVIEQYESISVKLYKDHIPFLYADRNTINISEDKTSYEFKFKTEAYNKDVLYIYGSNNNYAIIDNCANYTKELICYVAKEKIEEILTSNNEQFKIGVINDKLGIMPLVHILNITINYENVQKEDIIIQLTKIVGGITEKDTPFAYETNITEFPSFISQRFDKIFYMKKISNRPLMLFVDNPEETDQSPLKNNSKEMIINNAHYKYTFRIQPHEISDRVSIKGIGDKILFVYPEVLNYTSEEELTIRYIMDKQQYYTMIKLNLYSKSDLQCDEINTMKKCIVPKSHFRERKSGYFDTYHLNHESDYNIYYDSPLINVTLPIKNQIELKIEDENNGNTLFIGLNGVLNFKLDYNDNETNIFEASDLEEKSAFDTNMTIDNENGTESANVTCRLWKPIDAKLNMYCKLNTTFKAGTYHLKINNSSFNYKDKKVDIIYNANRLYLTQLNKTIPFIYSSRQVLNVSEETDIYELKYKIVEYNNETLFIPEPYGGIILDKCSLAGKELICKISKAEIEEFALCNGDFVHIFLYMPNIIENEIGFGLFISNGGIYINYTLNKKDIYVKITKLLDSYIDNNNLITYETNVTDITNVITEPFDVSLSNENKIECFFKKSEEISLLMICKLPKDHGNTFSLGEIKNQIELHKINVKYNFYILPTKNEEICNIKRNGGFVQFTFPKTLDFISKDSITIEYWMENPNDSKLIKLNPDGNDLECTVDSKKLKRCTVNKSHFKNKKSGYYFTHHPNHLNKSIIYYESSSINVILKEVILSFKEENNKNQINLGNKNRIFALVSNYNDKEKNIFNNNDTINFNAILTDINDYNAQYNANCRLWKPNDDYIRIICNLESDLGDSTPNLILNSTSFVYKEYTVFIEQDKALQYHQYNYDIPFLYSDKQIININDDKSYELTFKSEVFKDNILYIYGSHNNYAILDNCTNTEKEVNCKITKEKIEEILTVNNEQFRIGAIDDNVGIIPFDHILNITINYENVKKEEIYLKIIRTIGGTTEKGTPFAWETNITEFPTFTSRIFNDFGYFKKIPGRPLLFIINYQQEVDYNFTNSIENEEVIDNIHYKYIFKVQPCSFDVNLSISGNGTNILLEYPQTIDFNSSSETSIVIRFIADKPELMKNLKLNQNSKSYLECKDLNMMKKCIVPKSHFRERISGYFNTYHLNHKNNYNIYYDSSQFNVILPIDNHIELYIEDENNENRQIIGANGIINIIFDYNDNETNIFDASDLEEKSAFNTTITFKAEEGMVSPDVTCKLWKPFNEKLKMFCKLNTTFKEYEYNYNISFASFKYKDIKVDIISKANRLYFLQIGTTIPYLYSSKQVLDVNENTDIFELKYKIGQYNNEILFLPQNHDGIILDKCSVVGKELICKITKAEIEELSIYKDNRLDLYVYTPKTLKDRGLGLRYSNGGIYINSTLNKKDIYINITKLLDSSIDNYNLITYETNVTDIDNVNSKLFNIYLSNETSISCFFKKTEVMPLLMICELPYDHENTFSLGEIKKQIDLKDINIKYNFFILPTKNDEKCTIGGNGDTIEFTFPKTLNFTLNDSFTIEYTIEDPEDAKGIKLNPDGNDLECTEFYHKLKICTVNKSHFENKTNGYYYTHHLNHLNKSIIYYESSPINVILTESKEDSDSQTPGGDGTPTKSSSNVGIIVGCSVGGAVLIAAIIIIIVVVKKKKANSGDINGSSGNLLPNSGQVELIEGDKFE